jgi:hypothetical protein
MPFSPCPGNTARGSDLPFEAVHAFLAIFGSTARGLPPEAVYPHLAAFIIDLSLIRVYH